MIIRHFVTEVLSSQSHLADAHVDDLANAEHVADVGHVLSHRRKLQQQQKQKRGTTGEARKNVTHNIS